MIVVMRININFIVSYKWSWKRFYGGILLLLWGNLMFRLEEIILIMKELWKNMELGIEI